MTREVLWTSEEAANATGGTNSREWQATGLSLNTRTLEKGELFFALQGPSFDGHEFVRDALEKGATAAVVHRQPDKLPGGDAPLLMVDDTLAALNRLGAAARARSTARFVGVTGSVGKTSTKEALKACLSAQAPTAASAASFNNHWGVPLSLARMPRTAVYAINELGMNHAGEIRELTKLVRPDVAIITTVEAAHMEFFKDLNEIADAKCEIFEAMQPGGTAVLNRDHPLYDYMAQRARDCGVENILGFGKHEAAEVRLLSCELLAEESRVEADICGEKLDFTVGNPGYHWVVNALAALAAVKALGANLQVAADALGKLSGLPGRGEQLRLPLPNGGDFLLIDDSYNANPASVRASLNVLGNSQPGPKGRRIAVLGDMLELGPQSKKIHAELARPIIDTGIDLVFTCGSSMQALHEALPEALRGNHTENSQDLAPSVVDALVPGDVVSVKGSLGSRMAVVVDALKKLSESGEAQADAV